MGLQGEKGADGVHGKDGAPGPQGEKGLDGKDGQDGLGWEDMSFAYDVENGARMVAVRGDHRKEWPIPVPVYRGVWKDGTNFVNGTEDVDGFLDNVEAAWPTS